MKFRQLFIFCGLMGLLGILSCQNKPTLGVTDSGVLVQNPDYRKAIKAEAVVFDTRSPFDFNISKVPGSINLPVGDFESSKDPLDAARRLSLYGVDQNTPVVIIGEGKGEEQKLAWEFSKLGLTDIETLKTTVFRMLNIKPEPAKKNAPLWKPQSSYGELNQKQFVKKVESLKPQMSSRAKNSTFQGFPVGQVLKKRTLILTREKDWKDSTQFLFADHAQFNPEKLFDENGLMATELIKQSLNLNIKNYDTVFLIDSSKQNGALAYALVLAGAKSLYLVR